LQEIEKEFTAALHGKDSEIEIKEKQIRQLTSQLELLEAQISLFLFFVFFFPFLFLMSWF
jgi:hypothetical protein